jgi:hypothetical protein
MELQSCGKRPLDEIAVPVATQTRCVRNKQQARKKHLDVSHPTPHGALEDKFKEYLLFKAFDIISDGSYRRFVLKQKHNGDKWAIGLHMCIHEVSGSVKSVTRLTQGLQYKPATLKLYTLCQRVLQDLNPPTVSSDVWKICALTGMRTDKIVAFGKTSKGDVCYVHQKFHDFFCKLWFLARIDICIKQFTEFWCQVRADRCLKGNDYKGLCAQLQADDECVNTFCQYFIASMQHVEKSLTTHVENCNATNLLGALSV